MKPYKVRYTNEEGKKKQIGHRNGLKTTILLESSQHYIDAVLKPLQEEARISNEKIERNRKIAEKMREMAIKELEKDEKETI